MSKQLLFVSTHNMATNPRLIKEINIALENNCKVTVVCCEFDNWSQILNEEIKKQLVPQITYHGIPANRKHVLPWLASTLIYFLSGILLNLFPKNAWLLSIKSNKISWLLLQQLKKIKNKPDLVIAHNPGSFYPAKLFSKRHNIPFGIDLEDYHPGESSNKKTSEHFKRLNRNILNSAAYITAASPLILQYSQADLSYRLHKCAIILNYFPSAEFAKPTTQSSEKLKLVWFSQNISFRRGLEQMIPVIKENKEVELHLYGNYDEAFKSEWLSSGCDNIILHPSISQSTLHLELCKYDVGLAIEPGKDLNNELALSNKILAYFQAGLYIFASSTNAQTEFINQHPHHGTLSSLSDDDLKKNISQLVQQKNKLRASSFDRFSNAKAYCWETESEKLLNLWTELE